MQSGPLRKSFSAVWGREASVSVVHLWSLTTVSSPSSRLPLLQGYYQSYLTNPDSARFVKKVSNRYTLGTLERLASHGNPVIRRAAILSLGFLAEYDSNHVLGRSLSDSDRAVRTLAENSIRNVWRRSGSENQRQLLESVIRLNAAQQYQESIVRATELIEQAPWFAEAWNQRAIAYFHVGRHKESIRDCHQALEINPYHFLAAAGMGQCHLHLSNHSDALECFKRALRLCPDLESVRANVTYLERSLRRKRQ